jgi:DNA-binding XRE family transcriptional regulator
LPIRPFGVILAAMRNEPSPVDRLASMLTGLRAAGMTPSEIARQCGVSRQSLWRFEVGESRMPSHAVFTRLERLYLEHCATRSEP